MTRQSRKQTKRAKSLRATQTEAEGLLWSVLRGKQLCKMKFRRQHPIGPFFADFASVSQRLVVELDGEYHDLIEAEDLTCQQYLNREGWTVVRFTNDEVLRDVESVLIAIASKAGLPFSFRQRTNWRSGIMSNNDLNEFRLGAPPGRSRVRPPRGGGERSVDTNARRRVIS